MSQMEMFPEIVEREQTELTLMATWSDWDKNKKFYKVASNRTKSATLKVSPEKLASFWASFGLAK